MKKITCIIFASLLVIPTLKAYGETNHNAVLICGTTVEDGKSSEYLWWDGGKEGPKDGRNEFWNDTYLFWEIMYALDRCSLYIPEDTPQSEKHLYDHIRVLYGYGEDHRSEWLRYQAFKYDLESITDWGAYDYRVEQAFLTLSPEGDEPMSEQDNLFVYTGNHGAPALSFRTLDITEPSKPKEIGHYFYDCPTWNDEYPMRIFIKESYAYFAKLNEGIDIMDISDPSCPDNVGSYDTPSKAWDTYVSGDYAYIADGKKLQILDVSNPLHPFYVGSWPSHDYYDNNYIRDVNVIGDHAYVLGSKRCCIFVLDISDPSSPCSLATWESPEELETARSFHCRYPYAYIAHGEAGVWIVDISLTPPSTVAYCALSGNARDIYVLNDYAYVASFLEGLRIVSISNPENPEEVGYYKTPYEYALRVHAAMSIPTLGSPTYAYVTYGVSGLKIIDVTEPTQPYKVSHYDMPYLVWDVNVSGNHAYVSATGADDQVYLGLRPAGSTLEDQLFASWVDQIICAKRTFVMSQCFSGGFINDLESNNTVLLTSSKANQVAYTADDIPWQDIEDWQSDPDPPGNWENYKVAESENEVHNGKPYKHSESGLHIINALMGQTLSSDNRPSEPTYSDVNNDLLLSMWEAYKYLRPGPSGPVFTRDSRQYPQHQVSQGLSKETPQYSDMGEIGPNTFFGWDDGYPPDTSTGLYIDAIGIYPRYAVVIFDWLPNSEADLVGYYIYRKEGEGEWERRGSTRETQYQDTCNYNTHYYYHVTAIDLLKNESAPSNQVHVYIPKPRSLVVAGIGNPSPSQYLIQRTGYRNWGNSFEYTVDYDTEELIYRFENLNPEKFYLLALIHCAVDNSRIQELDVDGLTLLNNFSVTNKLGFDVLWVPQQVYADSEIQTNIRKVIGDDAVISEIIVAEFDTTFEIYGSGSDGGPHTENSSIPLVHLVSIYPIPAKSDISISFSIPREERVSLKIFDVSGREIEILKEGKLKAGNYTMKLNNIDLPSGIYFVRFVTDGYEETKKFVLTR